GREAALGGWGCLLGACRRVLLLLEATQHGGRLLVDGGRPAPSPNRVPCLPIGGGVGSSRLELLLQARAQLRRAHAQAAFAMQRFGLTVGRPEPFDGFLPRPVARRG